MGSIACRYLRWMRSLGSRFYAYLCRSPLAWPLCKDRLGEQDFMQIYAGVPLFGLSDDRLGEQILCIFSKVARDRKNTGHCGQAQIHHMDWSLVHKWAVVAVPGMLF